MANIHPDFKPRGYNQRDYVDLLYMLVNSLKGICTKLDADANVPLTTYLANCYTAIFDIIVIDSGGNRTGLTGNHIISVNGLSDKAQIELMYQLFNSFETLTEQLDTDVLTDSNYEALVYTAKFLMNVTNQAGNTLGVGTDYYFGPTTMADQAHLIELLYIFVDAIETLTEKLDADVIVNDTNYEALWFTASVTLRVENSKGAVVGNTRAF